MNSTLSALAAAIIDNPADRTVRLVYADALDESGEEANTILAEFIRAQVTLETMPDDDPERLALKARCNALFAANWIEWWKLVCAVLGLPEPYVPSQTLVGRVKRRLSRDRREVGAPYTSHTPACSIQCNQLGFTAQFIAGFPELISINDFTIDTLTGQFHNWFIRAPFHRLRLTRTVSEFEWNSLDGPHLEKLTELVIDRLTQETASRMASGSHMKNLTTLRVGPIHPAATVVRALVHNPPWTGLRSLTLFGICAPNVIQTLATDCTLTQLEELSFRMGEVSPSLPIADVFGAIGGVLAEIHAQFFAAHPNPPGPIRAADYWPVLQTLARSPLSRQLRRFAIVDDDGGRLERIASDLLSGISAHLLPAPLQGAELQRELYLSDECVKTLADGLNADKLERLELPRAGLSPAARTQLIERFGSRVVLA